MENISSYRLTNSHLALTVLNYGAIIQQLLIRDGKGAFINVVKGFENTREYLKDTESYGVCVGPFAGRITDGKFRLNGNTYVLDAVDGVHLHGGKAAWGERFWKVETQGEDFIALTLACPDNPSGYPGNVSAKVTYRLSGDQLIVTHEATTDAPTIINMTNHSYFDLSEGHGIDTQELFVKAAHYLEVDEKLLPTGKLLPVTGSSYDFRTEKKINGIRMDDTFVLDSGHCAIRLSSAKTGIAMQVSTDQPGVVIYTPKDGSSICFETQNFPDAPNHEHFPSAVLLPEMVYRNETIFKFSTT